MGVERQSSFEAEILSKSEGCQIYGYDFSVSSWADEVNNVAAWKDRAHFLSYRIDTFDKQACALLN